MGVGETGGWGGIKGRRALPTKFRRNGRIWARFGFGSGLSKHLLRLEDRSSDTYHKDGSMLRDVLVGTKS